MTHNIVIFFSINKNLESYIQYMPIMVYNSSGCLDYYKEYFPGFITMSTYSIKMDISYYNPNNNLISYLEVYFSLIITIYKI